MSVLQPQRIVLPEVMDPRVLAAAEELTARGLAKIILLGETEPIQAEARRLGLDISQARFPARCLVATMWMVQQMKQHLPMRQSPVPAAFHPL